MKRAFLIPVLLAAVILPATMALRAQEAAPDNPLDKLIEQAKARLAAKKATTGAQPIRFVEHVYDIRDLTTPLKQYPGHFLHLSPSSAGAFAFSEPAAMEPEPVYDGDMIVQTIRGYVAPGSWRELESASISYKNGYLTVRHTEAVQKLVEGFLAELRARSGWALTIHAQWVAISEADLETLLDGDSPSILAQDAAPKLADLVKNGKASILADNAVQCTDTQMVNLSELTRTSYLGDYDVEIAEGAKIADPIIKELQEGIVVQVKPILAGHGQLVVLEVKADAAHSSGKMGSVETPLGSIQTPKIDLLRIRTSIAAPLGRFVVVGGIVGAKKRVVLILTTTTKHP